MKRLKRRWIKLNILEKRKMKPVMARMEISILGLALSSPMVTVWKNWIRVSISKRAKFQWSLKTI